LNSMTGGSGSARLGSGSASYLFECTVYLTSEKCRH
jgi:hypothetical protein